MPAISRPFLIALVAAVLALAAFYATRGASGGDQSAAAPTTSAPAAPAEEPASEPTARASADGAPGARGGKSRTDAPSAKGVPAPVVRALARPGKVVIFFYRPGSADDRATGRAVAALRGQRGVTVFSAPIGRLVDYRAIVDGAGISQAPAVVIVAGDGTARVVQGYIDPATLAQDVADTG